MINVQTRGIALLILGVALLVGAQSRWARADEPKPPASRGPAGASAPGETAPKALAAAWPVRRECRRGCTVPT